MVVAAAWIDRLQRKNNAKHGLQKTTKKAATDTAYKTGQTATLVSLATRRASRYVPHSFAIMPTDTITSRRALLSESGDSSHYNLREAVHWCLPENCDRRHIGVQSTTKERVEACWRALAQGTTLAYVTGHSPIASASDSLASDVNPSADCIESITVKSCNQAQAPATVFAPNSSRIFASWSKSRVSSSISLSAISSRNARFSVSVFMTVA